MPIRSMNLGDDPVAQEVFREMATWPIFDPHSHIDPHRPAARNLDEILGYHYYTELAHSAGMPAAGRGRSRFPDAVIRISPDTWIGSTIRSSTPGCWRSPIRSMASRTSGSGLRRSASSTTGRTIATAKTGTGRSGRPRILEAVFLTNEFDDPLEGWNVQKYMPCLRTDDLVLKLHEPGRSSG